MKHTDPNKIRQAAAEEFQQSLGELEAVFDADALSLEAGADKPTQPRANDEPLPPHPSQDSALSRARRSQLPSALGANANKPETISQEGGVVDPCRHSEHPET